MATTITANLQAIMNITQIIDSETLLTNSELTDFATDSSVRISYTKKNQSVSLTGTTAPDVTDVLFDIFEGVGYLNTVLPMASILDEENVPFVPAEKRIVSLFLKNSTARTVSGCVTNPLYFSATGGTWGTGPYGYGLGAQLYPGQWALFYFGDYGPAASSSFTTYGLPAGSMDFLATFGTKQW